MGVVPPRGTSGYRALLAAIRADWSDSLFSAYSHRGFLMTSRTSHCLLCGAAIQCRNPNHRYCETCSKKWSTLNHRRRELAREAGLKANRESKCSVTLSEKSRCDLAWTVQVDVPFSYFASKNYIHQLSRSSGRVFVHRKSKSKRNEISAAIRDGLGEQRVAHNKLWIEILVQKPDHRGDAVNVVDLVCDAVKDAVPVDDRWFCIRQLDWEIIKEDPQLIIGIGQESCNDAQVCSFCGQIKPLEAFNKDKRQALGVGHECRECRRVGRVLRKQSTETTLAT